MCNVACVGLRGRQALEESSFFVFGGEATAEHEKTGIVTQPKDVAQDLIGTMAVAKSMRAFIPKRFLALGEPATIATFAQGEVASAIQATLFRRLLRTKKPNLI